jgi:signal transduction histidine kinase/ActR/RegA family two-component response regulator
MSVRGWNAMREFRAKPTTIKFALCSLVLATILPAWVASMFYIIRSNEAQRDLLEQHAVATARALVQVVDRELTGTRSALEALATSPSLASGDLSGVYDQAQEVLRRAKGTDIVLYGPTGNQLFNTQRPFGSPLPQQEAPRGILQAFETNSPVVSDLIVGRVSHRAGIGVTVPVFVDGKVPYALGIALYPEHLGEILKRQNLPPSWIASIFDSTGTIVARTHLVSEFVGKGGSPALIRRMGEVSEGVLESETLEGIPVLTGFSRSAVSGWAVAIGAPKSETLDVLQRSLWLSIAGATMLLVVCLWLAQIVSARIAKSIHALARDAATLGEGEVISPRRLSIKEADEAREALVRASHILRQRAAERDEAERTERSMVVAKRAAEEANRAKSEFLAGMSHEIRTPITCTIGMADLLEGSQLTAQQRRHVTLLKEASQSLLAIVDDLLDISKIEAGKLELDCAPIDVAAVAESAVAIVEHGAAAKGLELRRELATDLPRWIEGDATRLRQVLLNLLSNAIKFTERGRIVLRVMRAPGAEPAQLRFEVEDTGIGIDPAQHHFLFQRFSQIGDATHRQPRGTGLGLAISRNLVEMMGGTIGVDSRVGAGSTFWFTIPCVETKPQVAAEGPKTAADAAPRARVLVAEDNAMIRELIEAMLRDAGHAVGLVGNGIEAVEALEAGDFDVVLMDVQMPELDGIGATRWIRARSDRIRNIPIIALTAYAMADDVELCRAAGANEYLSKPINREALLSLVAKWSGSGHARPVATPDAAVQPHVMDVGVLDQLEGRLGASRVAALSAQFGDQLKKALDVIAATSDRECIADEMHDLISSAGALGCTELVERSRALMDAARRETGDLRPHVARLTMAASRALAAIEARTAATRQPSRREMSVVREGATKWRVVD